MPTGRIFSTNQIAERARKRLPRAIFDFIEGGAGSETAVGRNRDRLAQIALMPQALRDCSAAHAEVTIFDRRYSAPFGIAPMGFADLVRPGTDRALAGAAKAQNIPYVLSTAATTSIETIATIAQDNLWFQLYPGSDEAMAATLMERALKAGVTTLVATVDIPVPGKRPRDLTNGLAIPLRPSLRTILDVALHPVWGLRALRGERLGMANFVENKGSLSGLAHAEFVSRQLSCPGLDWKRIERIRQAWPHHLVIKGILNPQDALMAERIGADGIVVSNHGGRQLDSAPASIEVLPAIREACSDRLTLILDSGVRTGDDIARSLASGADFVLLGRPFLFAVAALGLSRGPDAIIDILRAEFLNTLIHLGCADPAELGSDHLWPRQGSNQ
ncbi:Alpha-hydroxyacid dehydrogenase, FMN-dependent L-lactate dehydrogenase [Bosea sp. LC85]|uniref:alpha-hydroxy acid oxidase n=1 Tax=Bosea sp. LC85 TaxID=1502851 RepID=UPI0004E41EFB|nr:alpha-hydroxy acid oxidase [Bosea sp. LC85]KFC64984.1 Alpha-hydroxyacid dehydrogenase, FMN-dependent L-lactate dehydrogenase [Bosea sp. LC85]